MKGKYEVLSVDKIEVKEGLNPRTEFNEELLFDLESSIGAMDQVMPIVVNKDSHGKLTLIDGERRLRALKASGVKRVECKVYTRLSAEQIFRMNLETFRRSPLNVIDEASAWRRLIDEFNDTPRDIATKYRVSLATVHNRLALLALCPTVQAAVTSEQRPLAINHALLLVGLSPEDQVMLWEQIGTCQFDQAERIVTNHREALRVKKEPVFPLMGVKPKPMETICGDPVGRHEEDHGNGSPGPVEDSSADGGEESGDGRDVYAGPGPVVLASIKGELKHVCRWYEIRQAITTVSIVGIPESFDIAIGDLVICKGNGEVTDIRKTIHQRIRELKG